MSPFDASEEKTGPGHQTESPYAHVYAEGVDDGETIRFSDDRYAEAVIEIDAEHVVDVAGWYDG